MRCATVLIPFLFYAAAAVWQDCSQEEGITNPQLVFTNVTSDPEPVVYGGHQKIYKTITNNGDTIEAVSAELSQYWQVMGHWLRFLKINTNQCKDHAELCPLPAGQSVNVVTQHPPLNWATPYGWYRSKQVYTETKTGRKIGCVDMQFRYCQDANHCVKDGEEIFGNLVV